MSQFEKNTETNFISVQMRQAGKTSNNNTATMTVTNKQTKIV